MEINETENQETEISEANLKHAGKKKKSMKPSRFFDNCKPSPKQAKGIYKVTTFNKSNNKNNDNVKTYCFN